MCHVAFLSPEAHGRNRIFCFAVGRGGMFVFLRKRYVIKSYDSLGGEYIGICSAIIYCALKLNNMYIKNNICICGLICI